MKKLLIISTLILSAASGYAQGFMSLKVLTQTQAGTPPGSTNTGFQHVKVTATVTGANIPATGTGGWGSATLYLRVPKSIGTATTHPASSTSFCPSGSLVVNSSPLITNWSSAGFPDLAFKDPNLATSTQSPSFLDGTTFSCVGVPDDGFAYIPLTNGNAASNVSYPVGSTYTLFEFDVPSNWVCANCMTIVNALTPAPTLLALGILPTDQPVINFIPPSTLGVNLTYNTAIIAQNNQPLPVTLVDFTAVKADDHSSRINWQTSSEVNSNYFEVERSSDAVHFDKVITHMKAAGQSATTLDYVTYDRAPLSGDNYYRLKMVDLSGKVEYSKTRKVTFDGLVREGISLTSNPVNSTTRLSVNSYVDQRLDYVITDVGGKMITGGSIDVTKGTGDYVIESLSSLANGTYFLTARGATINSTVKVTKLD